MVAYSCSDQLSETDEVLHIRNSVVYASGANPQVSGNPYCDVVPELCPQPFPQEPRIPIPTSDEIIGIVSNPPTEIVYKTPDKEYIIEAVGHPEVAKEFKVVTEDGVYVMAEVMEEEPSTMTESTYRIPPCIYQVFNLNYTRLYNGEATVSDFSEAADGRVTLEEQSSRIVVNITDDEIDDCDPPVYTIKTYDWCARKPAITAHAWMRHMMSGINAVGVTYTAIWGLVYVAAEECYEGLSCTECIDPKCILDKIEDAGVSTGITQTLRENYVALVDEKLNDAYDIDPGTVSTTALDVKEFLVKEDCEPTVIGVCGSEIVGEDFVNALENASSENVEQLLSELAKGKNWIVKKGFPSSSIKNQKPFGNCTACKKCAKRMECIFNRYAATMLCDKSLEVFQYLEESVGFGLEIDFDWNKDAERGYLRNGNGYGGVTLGYVYKRIDGTGPPRVKIVDQNNPNCCWEPTDDYMVIGFSRSDGNQADTKRFEDGEGLGSRVVINGHICEYKNALEIASLISHELIHSRIQATMTDLALKNGLNLDYRAEGEVWDALLDLYNQQNNPAINNPHDLFNAVFKKDLVDALMEMNDDANNSPENREKYLYLVLDNLMPDPEDAPPPLSNLAKTMIRSTVDWDGDGVIGDYDDNVLEYARLKRASQSLYVETDAQGFPIDANGTRVDAEDAVPKPYYLNSECPN